MDSAAMMNQLRFSNGAEAKSQKIKGYLVAASGVLDQTTFQPTGMYYIILRDSDAEMLRDWWANSTFISGKWFARPCPLTPRHGFVDSRRLMSPSDIMAIWKEARLADPESELLITPFINATYNAVVTPSMISIGPGHDGATNGNNAIMLPTQGNLLSKSQKLKSRITQNEYVEIVYEKTFGGSMASYLTQFRDGPEMPRAKDYIPRDVEVKQVIKVNGEDLLAWEELINKLEDKLHTVVWHSGGALGSHYAVHCRLNEVAYITTFEPIVGQTVKKVEETNRINYALVQRGLSYALSEEMDEQWCKKYDESCRHEKEMISILYALHHFNVIGNDESFLFGVSIGQMIRLCVAASLGELRHFSGMNAKEALSRTQIYTKYLANIEAGIEKIRVADAIFNKTEYWSSSYGGKKWAECTRATIDLINAALQFERKQSKKWFTQLVAKFNVAINVAHNGGKFLNKFISNSVFDLAANNQAQFCARYGAELFELVQALKGKEQNYRQPVNLPLVRNKLTRKERAQVDLLLANAKKVNRANRRCPECEHRECNC